MNHARLPWLLLLFVASACRSRNPELPETDRRSALDRYWDHAVDGRAELVHDLVPESDVVVPATSRVIPGAILRRPPLTLVELKRFPILTEIAGPQGWSLVMQASGQGLRRGLVDDEGVRLAHRFEMRVTVDFPDAESLLLDYPHLDDATVATLPRTPEGLLRFEPLDVVFYIVVSEDDRAWRVVLDSLKLQESRESIERRGETAAKPMPIVTMFTYHFPDYQEETFEMFTVVFDHKIVAEKRSFSGQQQVSPWLPLQPNSEIAPWNVRIQMTEITSLSWLKRVNKDLTELARPVADIIKVVR